MFMKIQKLLARLGLAAILLSTFNSQLSTAHAQGTAFTYQGRLDIAGVPASGTNDLTFTLYNAVTAGATVGTSNTFNDLVITNGLFTVTLDFGAGAFNGAARWLQIAARPGVSAGAYTNLAPRQAITPSPYAVFAGGAAAAGVTGTLPAGALAGTYSGVVNFSNAANSFAGNGAGLTSLNANNLTSGSVANNRLTANVALLNRNPQNFTGTNTFADNVGIGTTTPNFPLSFGNTGGEKISLWGQDTNSIHGIGIGGSRMEFYVPSTGHSFDFGVGSSANFSPTMRVSGNGNVGIGTITPGERLTVVGSGTTSASAALSVFNSGLGSLFRVRDDGNVGIGTSSPGAKLEISNGSIGLAFIPGYLNGVLDPNAFTLEMAGNKKLGVWDDLVVFGEVTTTAVNITSDRNAKEQFKPVSPREVLAKVAALPITEWQYKTQGDARHIGPMAQDFHAAFGTGRDDKHITSVDADGVALAAIQGLNEKLEEKSAEVEALKQSVAELKELVKQLTQPAGR
jgi:hypothetical protein